MNHHEELARLEALDARGCLPCPSCGKKANVSLGKRGSCQLHGEPFQSVLVHCHNRECKAPLRIEDGDIFNGGEPKARAEAIAEWNRYATTPALTVARAFAAENKAQREVIEKLVGAITDAVVMLTDDSAAVKELLEDALAEQQMRGSDV